MEAYFNSIFEDVMIWTKTYSVIKLNWTRYIGTE